MNGGASGVSQHHLEQENEDLKQENMRLQVDSAKSTFIGYF